MEFAPYYAGIGLTFSTIVMGMLSLNNEIFDLDSAIKVVGIWLFIAFLWPLVGLFLLGYEINQVIKKRSN